MFFSKFAHKLISQFGAAMGLPKKWYNSMAPFPHHILSIILISTKKEMLRTNTGWIITMMADVHAFGNWAIVQLVRKAIGPIRMVPDAKYAIPLREPLPSPNPTISGFIDSRPKSDDWINIGAKTIMPVDESEWLVFDKLPCSIRFLGKFCDLPTTALTKTLRNDRMFLHRSLAPFGAVLRAVDAAPGLLIAQHYHINVRGVK